MLFVALTRGYTWNMVCNSKWQSMEDVNVMDNIRKLFTRRHEIRVDKLTETEQQKWEHFVVAKEHERTIHIAIEVIYRQWKTHGSPLDWRMVLPLLPGPIQTLWEQKKKGLHIYTTVQ